MRQKCIRIEEVDSISLFMKTYTKGSCTNQCSKPNLIDCSCSDKCKNSGTCCFDYGTVNCDKMIDISKSIEDECKQTNPNCDLCDRVDNKLKCNQCKQRLYLYKGDYYEICPQDTTEDNSNFLCRDLTS